MKLKPCPFCGATPILQKFGYVYQIICGDFCFRRGKQGNRNARLIAAAWNRRAPTTGGEAVTDISKCQGIQCAKRESCWRFTAPAGIWQSWITVLTPEDCGHYWPIAPSNPRDTATAGEKP